jgi:hypothetical protein
VSITGFALAVLAVWRVTHLLVHEDGPWDVLVRVRGAAQKLHLDRLVRCFLCASVWIAVPFALVLTLRWRELVLLVPALSGGAILLERATAREQTAAWYEEKQEAS